MARFPSIVWNGRTQTTLLHDHNCSVSDDDIGNAKVLACQVARLVMVSAESNHLSVG